MRAIARAHPFRRCRFTALLCAAVATCAGGGWTTRLPAAAPGTQELSEGEKQPPRDAAAWNGLADARLREYGRTGRAAFLKAAETACSESRRLRPEVASNLGALVVATQLAQTKHRFGEARRSAEELRRYLPEHPLPYQLLGDALFQNGRLGEAEVAWRKLRSLGGSPAGCEWREAQLELARGHHTAGLGRLARGVELAGESPEAGWYIVQHGEWAFRTGDWATAEGCYAEALRRDAASISAQDHLAELRGAQGRLEEAVKLYEGLIGRSEWPELRQALGDLYQYADRKQEARVWHERALKAFLSIAAAGGDTVVAHHLAAYFTDSQPEPNKAVTYAQRELEEAQGASAHDALAWALHKAGRFAEAKAECAIAAASGTGDAHILYHAGMIYMAAGEVAEGGAYIQGDGGQPQVLGFPRTQVGLVVLQGQEEHPQLGNPPGLHRAMFYIISAILTAEVAPIQIK